jgi:hypothetical protein
MNVGSAVRQRQHELRVDPTADFPQPAIPLPEIDGRGD